MKQLGLGIIVAIGLTLPASAQSDGVKDRIEIQELLYVYAYTFDAKDCVSWSNLFAIDAVLDLATGKGK
jgi:hypothetical protein